MAEPVTQDLRFKSIIFGTDFTPNSENAARYAVHLAEHYSAKLIVAHALMLTQAAMEAEALSQGESSQRKNASRQLEEAVKRLPASGVEVKSALLNGASDREISSFADSYPCSLLVLGTHGGGRLEHALTGSTAEHILRATAVPTLTVGPKVAAAGAGTLPFRRILCATDLTPAAVRGLSMALQLAKQAEGKLEVLHVIPKYSDPTTESPEETARRLCQPMEEMFSPEVLGVCSPHAFEEEGNVYDRVMQHLREDGIDLLVLGVKKGGHLHFVSRASGAFRIIADAPCPVLTITEG